MAVANDENHARRFSEQMRRKREANLDAFYVKVPKVDGKSLWITTHSLTTSEETNVDDANWALRLALEAFPTGQRKRIGSTRAIAFAQHREPRSHNWQVDRQLDLSKVSLASIRAVINRSELKILRDEDHYQSERSNIDVLTPPQWTDRDMLSLDLEMIEETNQELQS